MEHPDPPTATSSTRSTSTERRRDLLGLLYGPDAARVDDDLDRLLGAHRRDERSFALDQSDAWVIAYPDHITAPGETPLHTLDRFVAGHLAPWVSGVHTLPVHPASGDGGFSVIDPHEIDPSFGTWADLHRLAGHAAWMADAVVNHLSSSSPWFAAFLAGDRSYANFFTRLAAGADTGAVVRPRTTPLAHSYRSSGGTERIWTTFSIDQVDLDYRNPAVLLAMVEVLARFVDHGAQAIRLDAVAFLWKDPATASIHLPETHAIVSLFRACLDVIAPDVVLVTETNVPHVENVSYFGDGVTPEADAVYQFALPPLVAHAMLTGEAGTLAAWASSVAVPPPGRTFMNFLASHDGVGLRPVEDLLADRELTALATAAESAGGVVSHRSGPGGVEHRYELAVSWFELMSTGVDEAGAIARHVAAHAIALALPGVPLLYLNSLFGVGHDRAAFERSGHGRDLNRRRLTRDSVVAALADRRSRANRVWTGIRDLLDARRSDPAFHPGASCTVSAGGCDGAPSLAIHRRASTGESTTVSVALTAPWTILIHPDPPKL